MNLFSQIRSCTARVIEKAKLNRVQKKSADGNCCRTVLIENAADLAEKRSFRPLPAEMWHCARTVRNAEKALRAKKDVFFFF